ncbi:hypothetical protein HMPREF9996_01282 [Aggregatibacter actinomycetemcomitans Y4]|nr:hypothetical protein HMPREF9996_01282 [Aggregatibacter actinomycetemcomitans Y4]
MPVKDKMMLKTSKTAMFVAKKSKMRIIDKNSLNKIIMKICLAIMAIKTGKSSVPMNFLRKSGNLMGKHTKKCSRF